MVADVITSKNLLMQNSYSRFQVIYDPDIISTYSNLQREPIISEIGDPLEKDRETRNR